MEYYIILVQSGESNARIFSSLSGIWVISHQIIKGFAVVASLEMLKNSKETTLDISVSEIYRHEANAKDKCEIPIFFASAHCASLACVTLCQQGWYTI